ncbi:MAG: hypothetical protein L3J71_11450, partial [Victivallaceae bacterium]|nr:hypothetical protein [Victivallaceae bacterium]
MSNNYVNKGAMIMFNKFRFLSGKILFSAVFCAIMLVTGLTAVAVDDFVYSEHELLSNPSLEKVDLSGSYAIGYKNKTAKLINDYSRAKDGNYYISVKSDKIAGFYFQGNVPLKKLEDTVVLSFWVKGKAWMSLRLGIKNQARQFIGTEGVKVVKFDSEQWEKITVEINHKAIIERKKLTAKAKFISFYFSIKGNVCFDKFSLLNKSALKKVQALSQLVDVSTQSEMPLLSVPRISTPITLDGKIGKNEWQAAAGTTGLLEMSDLTLSDRQLLINCAYDKDKIYFSFFTKYKDINRSMKNLKWGNYINALEIWLKPPGKGWQQLLVTTAGEKLYGAQNSNPLGKKWQVKTVLEDSGETRGGVLTFDKKIWTTEVAIAFSDLGVATPKSGERWRINFNYDLAVVEGQPRSAKDWTTWSPLKKGFNSVEDYGLLNFAGDIPALKITGFGAPGNSSLDLTGTMLSQTDRKVDLFTWIAPADERKQIIFSEYSALQSASATVMPFKVREEIKLNATKRMNLFVLAKGRGDSTPLARLKIPFNLKPGFNINVCPVYTENQLLVKPDTGKLTSLPNECKVEVVVTELAKKQTVLRKTVKRSRKNIDDMITLDMKSLLPGKYAVKCTLKQLGGAELVTTRFDITIIDPKQFPWYNNRLGVTKNVPAPWLPIKTAQSATGQYKITVTDREYLLNNNGLPAQIKVLGKALFKTLPQLI